MWVFGLYCRTSNRLLMFPVDQRYVQYTSVHVFVVDYNNFFICFIVEAVQLNVGKHTCTSFRDAESLLPIIVRFVAPGAEIYSDGWASYNLLNQLGE